MLAQIGSLNEKETQAIAEFEARLNDTLPGRVRSLILFGSKARGDAHPDSDIDLLVIIDEFDQLARDAIAAAEWAAFERTGVTLEPHVYSHSEAQLKQNLGVPFMQNVAQDGQLIEGEPLMVKPIKRKEVAQGALSAAGERLRTAEAAVDLGSYRDAVSRSYYAFLNAADAVLVAKGFTPKSHAGTIHLFNLHIVKTGLVDSAWVPWFSRMEKARLDADYDYERIFTRAEAEAAVDRAQKFVAEIEQLLPQLLATHSEETRQS